MLFTLKIILDNRYLKSEVKQPEGDNVLRANPQPHTRCCRSGVDAPDFNRTTCFQTPELLYSNLYLFEHLENLCSFVIELLAYSVQMDNLK